MCRFRRARTNVKTLDNEVQKTNVLKRFKIPAIERNSGLLQVQLIFHDNEKCSLHCIVNNLTLKIYRSEYAIIHVLRTNKQVPCRNLLSLSFSFSIIGFYSQVANFASPSIVQHAVISSLYRLEDE